MRPPTATTRLCAVFGYPIRHSLSPVLFNAAFEACSLDWVHLAFEVDEAGLADAFAAVRTLPIGGANLTMPLKTAAVELLDEVSDAARALAAVNCVVNDTGRLIGHNTDGDGFVDSLRAAGVDPAGLRCVVLGAGGAARSVIRALGGAGASEIVVVNRTATKAEAAATLAGERARAGGAADLAGAQLVVNATSVGMGTRELPIDPALLAPHHVVADLVYHPIDTALLAAARARGATTLDGVGMLVHQAARAFSLWTGLAAPIDQMMAAARARLVP